MFASAAIAFLQALPEIADVVVDCEGLSWSLVRDPTEPYLDDHRPGGQPLLGTVANIDAISGGLLALMGDAILVSVTDVEVAAPLIFKANEPKPLHISAALLDHASVRATSHSVNDGVATVHLTGQFHFADRFAAPPQSAAALLGPVPVTSEEIYACLFHGPSYQVIAQASRHADRMISMAASKLPPWRSKTQMQALSPRVIEFGLQTAGLLQVARDGTMMIPKRIARIARYSAADIGDGTVYAMASRNADATLDIDIVDGAGALLVRIGGYGCEPLPFDHDNCATAALADLLNNQQIEMGNR